jgi:methionyl aminopeptidase
MTDTIQLRSPREIERMRRAGQVVHEAHRAAAQLIRPGVTTRQLDTAIVETFAAHNAEPLFLGYPGKVPFPNMSCVSVNEEIVHGIPGDRALVSGDIVSIDTGCRIGGWCGDAAVTHAVGDTDEASQRLLHVTKSALELAIELLASEDRWSAIAARIQAYVEGERFAVIEDFVGHGIGREMHEAPQVPNFDSQRLRQSADFEIRPGLVLAIEPMVTAGSKQTRHLTDHWTVVTADGSRAAHFEHTVAVTGDGPLRLTGADE